MREAEEELRRAIASAQSILHQKAGPSKRRLEDLEREQKRTIEEMKNKLQAELSTFEGDTQRFLEVLLYQLPLSLAHSLQTTLNLDAITQVLKKPRLA